MPKGKRSQKQVTKEGRKMEKNYFFLFFFFGLFVKRKKNFKTNELKIKKEISILSFIIDFSNHSSEEKKRVKKNNSINFLIFIIYL